MIFFTSDTHFGHKNVIQFCNRPFENVECMERGLIERWNREVKPNDHVYHLGDLAFQKPSDVLDIIRKLNGKIHFVPGNHDSRTLINKLYELPQTKIEVYAPYLELNQDGRKFVLCHYPIESWNNMTHGSIHLHGHSHGKSRAVTNRFDVGVDAQNYAPVPLSYFVQAAKEGTPRPDRIVCPPTV